MRMKATIVLALGAASIFAAAAMASAAGSLTLSASPSMVTYPHSAKLTVGFPDQVPATATILAMPVNSSTWTTTTLMATTSTPTVTVKPKVTTYYKAWISDESSSAVTTVSVAAHLLKPQINGYVHSDHRYTIKGKMSPAEVGTVTVTFYRMETVSLKRGKGHVKKATWVQHGDALLVGLKYQNSQWSTWTTKWTPDGAGWWKVVVSHEDVTHVASSASTYKWVRN